MLSLRTHLLFLALLVCGCSQSSREPPEVDAQNAEPLNLSSLTYETGFSTRTVPVKGIRFADGFLLAGERVKMEVDGELVFKDRDGVDHMLLHEYVAGIFAHPSGAYVFAGSPSEMGFSYELGGIYDVTDTGPQGVPSLRLLHSLIGSPGVVQRPGNVYEIHILEMSHNNSGKSTVRWRCFIFGADTSLVEKPCPDELNTSK